MLGFRSQCVELKEGQLLKSNIYELLSGPEAVHSIMFSGRIIKAHKRTHSTGLHVYLHTHTHTQFFLWFDSPRGPRSPTVRDF